MNMKTQASEKTKAAIMVVAVKLAREKGLFQFSRVDVANAAGVGESSVSYQFGSMPELRTAITKHAVEHEILPILADARAGRENVGVHMSRALRRKIATHIAA